MEMIMKKRRGSGKRYSSPLQGLLPLENDQVAYSEMHRILEKMHAPSLVRGVLRDWTLSVLISAPGERY